MKTICTLVLVIAIQVIAMSQTQNQTSRAKNSLLSPIKRNNITSVVTSKVITEENVPDQFSKRIEQLNEQIIELESLKGKLNEEINEFFVAQKMQSEENNSPEKISPVTKTGTLSKAETILNLLKEADELNRKGTQLRNEARTLCGIQKKQFLASAEKEFEQAFVKQIEASQMSGLISLAKFNENKLIIDGLLTSNQSKTYLCAEVRAILRDADRAMKLAQQIREESTVLENAAKLGNYGNAEEKEFTALNKQEEALSFFNISYCAVTEK